MKTQEYVLFKLQNEFYGVEVEYVENIERIAPITRVPYTASHVRGVVNLRGIVVPIIDLRKKFGMTDAELTDDSRMIIVDYEENKIGMLVDSSYETFQMRSDEIDSAVGVSKATGIEYIKSIGKKDGRVVMLIDLAKVLEMEM